MSEFLDGIWEVLNGFNLSTIDLFYIDENKLTFAFTPTLTQEPYTIAWINFNFNISKVIENLKIALNLDDKKHPYYIMCDNALILLVSAFENYLTFNYINIRKTLGNNEISPKDLTFQRKEELKEKYNELGIDIAHLDENLWREIFSSSESEKGIIN